MPAQSSPYGKGSGGGGESRKGGGKSSKGSGGGGESRKDGGKSGKGTDKSDDKGSFASQIEFMISMGRQKDLRIAELEGELAGLRRAIIAVCEEGTKP